MKNSLTLPGGIVHFQNLEMQPPQGGPSFLGVKKERPAMAPPQRGIEHSALSSRSQMFAHAPIAHIFINESMHVSSGISRLHNSVCSAAEAELAALFLNTREAKILRLTLEEMGHKQAAKYTGTL